MRVVVDVGDFAVENGAWVMEAIARDDGLAVACEETGRRREVVFAVSFVDFDLADCSMYYH